MELPTLPLIGSCRCGQLRIEISAPPLMTAACHCRGCQRMSSSAYSLTAMIPAAGFRVIDGEPVKGGLQGPQADHYFCPNCKSWMFTRLPGVDDFLNVRPTMFDDPALTRPYIETMTREKLPWVETPARHSYKEFPPMEDFQKLMDEFAAGT